MTISSPGGPSLGETFLSVPGTRPSLALTWGRSPRHPSTPSSRGRRFVERCIRDAPPLVREIETSGTVYIVLDDLSLLAGAYRERRSRSRRTYRDP
jgi:hypothetical protein